MPSKVTILFTVLSVAAITFLIGNIAVNQTANSINNNSQLLANNSLIARFNTTTEKGVATPIGLFKLSNDEATDLKLSSATGEILFYNSKNGQVRSLSMDNLNAQNLLTSVLVAQIKTGLKDVQWSSDDKIIIGSDDAGFIYYNLGTNVYKRLDPDIKKIAIGQNNIVYLSFNVITAAGLVKIADLNFADSRTIFNTRVGDWDIDWVGSEKISLTTDNNQQPGTTFLLDTQNGNLQRVLDKKQGLQSKWSPDGEKLAYSYIGADGEDLGFWDISEEKETPLGIPIEATYCAWASDGEKIYCHTNNTVTLVDISAPSPSLKTILTESLLGEMDSFLISANDNYFIFHNAKNGKIYGYFINR